MSNGQSMHAQDSNLQIRIIIPGFQPVEVSYSYGIIQYHSERATINKRLHAHILYWVDVDGLEPTKTEVSLLYGTSLKALLRGKSIV